MSDIAVPYASVSLKPEHLPEYERLHRALFSRMVRVHHTLEMMRRIEAFPWSPFIHPDDQTFWQLTLWSFGDCAVLFMHGLVTDSGVDHLSLNRFKNLVRMWLEEQWRAPFDARCRTHRVETELDQVAEQIGLLRNNSVAHQLLLSTQSRETPTAHRLTWSDIDKLWLHIKNIFDTVSLGSECILALPGYGQPRAGREPKADLEYALDDVARRAESVSLPEKRPELWKMLRPAKSADYMQKLNQLRLRAGLAPVD